MPKKIIIDTDPGVDDSMAILFAFNSPELEVVGLTSIFGNVHTDLATQNALRLVELSGHPAVPVAHGADLPLVVPLSYVADFVHGTDGLGNTYQPPPHGQALDISAAQFIVETVMAQPGEITLVPVGPLTNIALALALEPRIAENVAEVVIMGGAATVNGNVTPAAEANIIHDPHAADIVFTANWPVTMVGLDVTTQTLMSEAYLASLRSSRTGQFIFEISRFYQKFYEERFAGMQAIQTHDPSVIAYLLNPGLFTIIQGPLRVISEGIAIGQTLLSRQKDAYDNLTEWSNIPDVNVCVGVDAEGVRALFKERITQAN